MIYIYSENFSQKRRPKKIAKINIHIMYKKIYMYLVEINMFLKVHSPFDKEI